MANLTDRFSQIFSPFVVLKNLVKKPMTLQFPYESLPDVKDYRGRHFLDKEKCTGCGVCETICPNVAIEIKEFNGNKYPQVHLGKCCFCGLCAEYCPKDALKLTPQAMMVTLDKESAILGPEELSKLVG